MRNSVSIALLAARLDSGGVADHVKTLAGALVERGLSVLTLERGDRFVADVRARCEASETECIGLHFVSYGWARRGLLSGKDIAEITAACAGRRVVLFFHELWIGAAEGEPWRNRLIGEWQRRGIMSLVSALQPNRIVTSNPVYQAMLAREGVSAEVLGLSGNVPMPTDSDRMAARAWLKSVGVSECGGESLAAVFGTIHPEWDGGEVVASWRCHLQAKGTEGVVLVLGRSGAAGAGRLASLRQSSPGLRLIIAGEQSAGFLAGLLRECSLGLATSPWALIGKSGTAAAFLEAGLPVVVTRDDWQLRRGITPAPTADPLLWKWREGKAFDWGQCLASRRSAESRLGAVANRWKELICML